MQKVKIIFSLAISIEEKLFIEQIAVSYECHENIKNFIFS